MAVTRASFLGVGVRHVVTRLPGETLEPGWTCAGGRTAGVCVVGGGIRDMMVMVIVVVVVLAVLAMWEW